MRTLFHTIMVLHANEKPQNTKAPVSRSLDKQLAEACLRSRMNAADALNIQPQSFPLEGCVQQGSARLRLDLTGGLQQGNRLHHHLNKITHRSLFGGL